MKHLYDEKDERYTEDGMRLAREINEATASIIERWGKEYSARDILNIAQQEVGDLALLLILDKGAKEK